MNILFISTNYPYPVDSGHNIRTYYTLKCLASTNRIFMVCFSKKKMQDVTSNDPIKEICQSVDVFYCPEDFSSARLACSLLLNLFSAYPFVVDKYYRNEAKEKIDEIIQKNAIDLVHVDLLPLARYLDQSVEIPVALTEHNVESQRLLTLVKKSKNILFKTYMYLQYKKLLSFEREQLAKCAICVAVSPDDKVMLKKMNDHAQIVTIPNGVDLDFFHSPGITPVPNSVVWVGAMNDFYNKQAIDYFCDEIYEKIKAEVPDLKVTLVGNAPTKTAVELANRDANVQCPGYVEDVRPYMEKALIFIAPMLSGGGTKLKVLNAMAMGKAVVTTSFGAEGIEATPGENIIIADHPEEFAGNCIALLKNPGQARILGKKGRELVLEKYDWRKLGEEYNRLYKILMEKKPLAGSSEK